MENSMVDTPPDGFVGQLALLIGALMGLLRVTEHLILAGWSRFRPRGEGHAKEADITELRQSIVTLSEVLTTHLASQQAAREAREVSMQHMHDQFLVVLERIAEAQNTAARSLGVLVDRTPRP